MLRPSYLKCEYKINPTGIDVKQPRFSWITQTAVNNKSQSAYRIIVSSAQQVTWDTGKINSFESVNIPYNGMPLQSNKAYYWKVMIWTDDKPSEWSEEASFTTGLYNRNEWKAKWLSYELNEPEEIIKFHPDIDKWIWHPYTNDQDRFKTIILSRSFYLNDLDNILSAFLIVTADEKYQLFLNEKLIAQSDDKIFSWARPALLDIRDILKQHDNQLKAVCSNSYVDKPGFILRLEITYNTGERETICTDEKWLSMFNSDSPKSIPSGVIAITGDLPWRVPHHGIKVHPAVYFHKKITPNKKIKSAFVYCAALGLYHLTINDQPVTESKLSPLWSNFNKRVYYKSFDVTSILKSQIENNINLILADGYFAGYSGWEKGRGYYGEYPAFIFQLMITYDDNSEEIIVLDESWTASTGPIYEADILMGETYCPITHDEYPDDPIYDQVLMGTEQMNGLKNEPDLLSNCPVRDQVPEGTQHIHSSQKPPQKLSPVGTTHLFQNFEIIDFTKQLSHLELKSYPADDIKIRAELKPVFINKIDNQKFIIDFGQNFAGYVRLNLPDADNRIKLRYAEFLNIDGSLYLDNIRMARAEDSVGTRRGAFSEITWEPKFTYHGFRYAEITGLNEISSDTVTGISINSLPEQTTYFESSDKKLNKLFNCILWNQKSNYIDIPTDCPQRDERLGWTGDAVSYFRTAAFNHDISAFYTKWFNDIFDEQKTDGALPPFAPLPPLGVGPVYYNAAGWADAGVITPWEFYNFYNDKEVLQKYYPQMKLFVESLVKKADNFVFPDDGYGDWLSIGEETSKSFIASAYFAYDCSTMNKIASVLNEYIDADYFSELFNQARLSFQKTFLNEDGSLKQKTQTAAVLAIHFNLLNEEDKKKTAHFLIDDIITNNYHFTTGFLGLSFIMPVLSSLNRNDIAWKVLTNNEFPSWFFMIDHGATTLWERWDSYHPEKGFFDPTMNSFNHCSLGCVGEWLITGLAGINVLEPGFKKILFEPYIPKELSFVKASFKSMNGTIKSEWRKDGNEVILNITVPFNTSAEVKIPGTEHRLKLPPGSYEFKWNET